MGVDCLSMARRASFRGSDLFDLIFSSHGIAAIWVRAKTVTHHL